MGSARLAAIVLVLLAAGAVAARSNLYYQATDFFCLYHGARSLVVGHDPYDEAWWKEVTGGLYPDPSSGGRLVRSSCPGRYGYPLWTAVVMLPIGALPIEYAASAWMAISFGAAFAGAWWAWLAVRGPARLAPLFGILFVTAQPLWLLVIYGQITGVMLGLAGLFVLLVARGRAVAGAALSGLALKPQIVALAIPAIALRALAQRRWRVLAAVVGTGTAMVVVPMLFVPGWIFEWLDELVVRRARVAVFLPTAWGLAADVLGNAAVGALLVAALVIGCWLLVRRSGVDDVGLFSLTLPISLFATPYAWSYDFLVLFVSYAFVLARAGSASPRTRMWLTLGAVALAGPLQWLFYTVAFPRGNETLSAVVTAATALLVAAALRVRSSRASVSA
ncbi:MAG TPA: glycosyltransferase family 87 protein [Candidatus Limnocylindria bacterium]